LYLFSFNVAGLLRLTFDNLKRTALRSDNTFFILGNFNNLKKLSALFGAKKALVLLTFWVCMRVTECKDA